MLLLRQDSSWKHPGQCLQIPSDLGSWAILEFLQLFGPPQSMENSWSAFLFLPCQAEADPTALQPLLALGCKPVPIMHISRATCHQPGRNMQPPFLRAHTQEWKLSFCSKNWELDGRNAALGWCCSSSVPKPDKAPHLSEVPARIFVEKKWGGSIGATGGECCQLHLQNP